MEKKNKAKPNIADIASKMFHLLDPLTSEDRQRAMNGALAMLGEAPGQSAPTPVAVSGVAAAAPGPNVIGLSPKGGAWMKQNGLTLDQVERVFDISNQGVDLMAAEAPGRNRKEQTRNTYVLVGLSRMLASGDANFADKDARKACEDLGCYDPANHAAYMNDRGNLLTGSKSTGWKLTSPGLKFGADLVKELTKKE
jgi:hypothetical protein